MKTVKSSKERELRKANTDSYTATSGREVESGQCIVEKVQVLNLSSNWEDKIAESQLVLKISGTPPKKDLWFDSVEIGPGMGLQDITNVIIEDEVRYLARAMAGVGLDKNYDHLEPLIRSIKPIGVCIYMVGAESDAVYQDQIDSLMGFVEDLKAE